MRAAEDLPNLDEETRDGALEVLGDVLEWRTTSARWAGIAVMVDAMVVAVDTNDWAALRVATVDLELSSPIRVGTVGDKQQDPPPKPVREQVNRLVHSLGKGKPSR
ncbi:MAG TPA: CATRA system-associated protein [Pseudonocardiaceae bacterium]